MTNMIIKRSLFHPPTNTIYSSRIVTVRPMSKLSYTLYYWPEIPGRGEYVRMLFEASNTPYTDSTDIKELQARVMSTDTVGHPPHFAPPVLGVTPNSRQEFYISQTAAILGFLGPRLGLMGDLEAEDEIDRDKRRAQVQQVALTALDLMVEAHDSHHPIANGLYCIYHRCSVILIFSNGLLLRRRSESRSQASCGGLPSHSLAQILRSFRLCYFL
jgi:hypothetical protein